VEFLDKYQVLTSQNFDEFREVLASQHSVEELDIVRKNTEIDLKVNSAPLVDLGLSYVTYGQTEVSLQSPASDGEALLFGVVTGGHGSISHQGEDFEICKNRGIIKTVGHALEAKQADFSTLALNVPRSALERHMKGLFGNDLGQVDLEFDVSIDFMTPMVVHFRNSLEYAAEALNGPLFGAENAILLDSIRDTLLSNILTCLPNSAMAAFDRQHQAVALPFYVVRARDYIHGNAHTSITLETLSKYAGCSYRTLQTGFKNTYDVSPMAYLKAVRLQNIHHELLSSDGSINIQNIARKWGFIHMGHFAQDYRRKFGHRPSETIRFHRAP